MSKVYRAKAIVPKPHEVIDLWLREAEREARGVEKILDKLKELAPKYGIKEVSKEMYEKLDEESKMAITRMIDKRAKTPMTYAEIKDYAVTQNLESPEFETGKLGVWMIEDFFFIVSYIFSYGTRTFAFWIDNVAKAGVEEL